VVAFWWLGRTRRPAAMFAKCCEVWFIDGAFWEDRAAGSKFALSATLKGNGR
jgi:hypothetical protein